MITTSTSTTKLSTYGPKGRAHKGGRDVPSAVGQSGAGNRTWFSSSTRARPPACTWAVEGKRGNHPLPSLSRFNQLSWTIHPINHPTIQPSNHPIEKSWAFGLGLSLSIRCCSLIAEEMELSEVYSKRKRKRKKRIFNQPKHTLSHTHTREGVGAHNSTDINQPWRWM